MELFFAGLLRATGLIRRGVLAAILAWMVTPALARGLDRDSVAYRPELGAGSPALDIYSKPGFKNAPVLIYVHGGAWMIGDKGRVHDFPAHFSDLGFILVSVNYRLVPHARVEDQLTDIDAAIGWVADNIARFGGDGGNLHLMGHSAGAHLVAMAALAPGPRAQRLVQAGAIRSVVSNDTRAYDIPGIAAAARGGKLPRLYQRPFGMDPARWRALSPQYHVKNAQALPDFLLLYSGQGAGDTRAQFAETFAQALRRQGAMAELGGYPDLSHGDINRGTGRNRVLTEQVDRFLTDHR